MLEFLIDLAVRCLRSSLTQNSILLGRENLPPFFGGFPDRFEVSFPLFLLCRWFWPQAYSKIQ